MLYVTQYREAQSSTPAIERLRPLTQAAYRHQGTHFWANYFIPSIKLELSELLLQCCAGHLLYQGAQTLLVSLWPVLIDHRKCTLKHEASEHLQPQSACNAMQFALFVLLADKPGAMPSKSILHIVLIMQTQPHSSCAVTHSEQSKEVGD